MTWLIILALAIWVFRQNQRLGQLENKVRILSSAPPVPVAPPRVDPIPTPPIPAPVAPAEQAEPRPEPAPAPEPPRLRPAPIVEQILTPRAPVPEPAPPPKLPEFTPSRIAQAEPAPSVAQPRPAPPPPPLATPPRAPRPSIAWAQASTWLAENGLAWLGGAGLALGGLLMVVYAAQRGIFTPTLRIASAAVLGLLMVAASEWIRRQTKAPGGRHGLAAAAAAGAGAVTLYGATWAAYALYHLISLPLAAGLAVSVSGGLLALALLHGQALALLALVGAFLAPAMTGGDHGWSTIALESYLVLLGLTGAAVNGLRRWGQAGLVTVVGLMLWTAVALLRDRGVDAAGLMALALAGPPAAVLWRRRRPEPEVAAPTSGDVFLTLPLTALIIVGAGSLGLWGVQQNDPSPLAVVFGGLLIAATAAMAALRLVPVAAFVVPVGLAGLGALFSLSQHPGPVAPVVTWRVFGLIAVMAASGLVAGWRVPAKTRTPLLAIAAVGALLLANCAWPFLNHAPGDPGRLVAGLTAALLALGAIALARRVEDAVKDPGLGLWIAAAAELLFLTVHASTPAHLEPVIQAGVAVLLAAAANRLAWRGLAATAVAGGLVALAVMLRPSFVFDATDGRLALPLLGAVTAGASAALLVAARIVGGPHPIKRGASHKTESEALSTAALLVLLTGAFLVLHAILARLAPPAAHDNPLLEASLRTALMLAAGLLLAARGRADDGPIARWRLILVTGVGVVHGLLTAGAVLNPWWGLGSPPVGLPVLNDLLLSFLAPALLLAATARKRPEERDGWSRGWIVAAAVFAVLWVVITIRHAFHGTAMHDAPIGRAELSAYALTGLLTARAFLDKRLAGARTAWLSAAAPAVGWTALGVASLVFGLIANPWWGAMGDAFTSWGHIALILALHLAAVGAAFSLRRGDQTLVRAALCVSVGLAFILVVLVVRAAFHGMLMNLAAVGRIELCVYALLALGAARAFQVGRLLASPRAAWLKAAAPAVGWIALAATALVFGLAASPWWGWMAAPPASPVYMAVVLALYVAAAALAAELRRGPPAMARAAFSLAVALVLAFVVLTVRWIFHGARIDTDVVGPAEACAYAVVGLLTARAFRSPRLDAAPAAWLKIAAPAIGWTALAWAGLVFGWLASPWWGPLDAPMISAWHVALVLAFYAAGAAAALTLRRDAQAFDRAALCVSVGVLFAFVTLLTRFAFQGVDMRQGLDRGGLETWTFSAVWTVFGLIVLFRASARKDVALRWLGLIVLLVTAAKVLLFDMATLDGVVRAASFLAVGALFIAGALVARRLNARHKSASEETADNVVADRSPPA